MGGVAARFVAIAAVAAALGGCADDQAARPQAVARAPAPDDDAYCQAKGFKPGSDGYVSCRKDRDYVAALREQHDKQNASKLGNTMLDNPGTPGH
jgi:hypothetical protein